jgi:hypothetical protein
MRFALLLVAGGLCDAAVCAQNVAPAKPLAPKPAASGAAAAAPKTPDQTQVIEDDGVRIEETRVRGQVRRVVVQSKLGDVRAYEIIVPPGGYDPSRAGISSTAGGTAGQRAWSLFTF